MNQEIRKPVVCSLGVACLLVAGYAAYAGLSGGRRQGPHSPGFYLGLRWCVAIAGVAVATASFNWKWPKMGAFFVVLALLFNPLVSLHMSRGIWGILDFTAFWAFLIGPWLLWPREPSGLQEPEKRVVAEAVEGVRRGRAPTSGIGPAEASQPGNGPIASPKTGVGDGSKTPTENTHETGVRLPMSAFGIGAFALIAILVFVWNFARETADKPATNQRIHSNLADAKRQLNDAKRRDDERAVKENNAELKRRDDERAVKENPDPPVYAQKEPVPDNANRVVPFDPLEKERNDEASAEKALKALGASVRRDHSTDAKPIVEIDLAETKTTDADLPAVAAIPMLRYLNLRGTDVTDEGLKKLRGLKNLNRLVLSHTNVTDIGMKELAAIKSLDHLDVSNTAVTAKGLSAFQEAREKLGHPKLFAIVHK